MAESASSQAGIFSGADVPESEAISTPPASGSTAVVHPRTTQVGTEEPLDDRIDLLIQRNEFRNEVSRLREEQAEQLEHRPRIFKGAPFLAMRKPLSTLLIVVAIGIQTKVLAINETASYIYIGVGALVLLVTAIQFWRNYD